MFRIFTLCKIYQFTQTGTAWGKLSAVTWTWTFVVIPLVGFCKLDLIFLVFTLQSHNRQLHRLWESPSEISLSFCTKLGSKYSSELQNTISSFSSRLLHGQLPFWRHHDQTDSSSAISFWGRTFSCICSLSSSDFFNYVLAKIRAILSGNSDVFLALHFLCYKYQEHKCSHTTKQVKEWQCWWQEWHTVLTRDCSAYYENSWTLVTETCYQRGITN